MAAGLGFKTFTTGEVLTAGDVNGYLMQGINVFASTAARDAAITLPQEGQFAFTKDTNGLWYYDGAAWVASGATGDIEGVTAGVGISGGGTSGTVTVTNSMATAIDAKGDLVPGTGADTFARLAVGANDTVLTADSAQATGLKWATPITGGMTLISTTTLSGSSITLSSIPQTYNELQLWIINFDPSATARFRIAPNGGTTGTDNVILEYAGGGTPSIQGFQGYMRTYNTFATTPATNTIIAVFPAYTVAASRKSAYITAGFLDGGGGNRTEAIFNKIETNAVTSLVLSPDTGTFDGGTAYLYGVK